MRDRSVTTSAFACSPCVSQAGEFWYELSLTGEPTAPVELPMLRCAVGGTSSHAITVSNPIGEELPLQLRSDNPQNFRLEGPKATGGALVLPPYGELTTTLTYTPSALEEEQRATISLMHPKLGEWVYNCRGVGHVPAEMPTVSLSAPLGHTTSGTIGFRNPFDQPLTLDLTLEQPLHEVACKLSLLRATDGQTLNVTRFECSQGDQSVPPPFELLARRMHALAVPPGANMQFPFSFVARDMGESHASLVLCGDYKGRQLRWRFPIEGTAQTITWTFAPLYWDLRSKGDVFDLLWCRRGNISAVEQAHLCARGCAPAAPP